jgi:hypothetical protein
MHIGEVPKIPLPLHKVMTYDTPLGAVVECHTCGESFFDLIEHGIHYSHNYQGGSHNGRDRKIPKEWYHG